MPRDAVIMGDLNCTPDSEEYARLIGPWSARFGRLAQRDGLVDAWTAAGHDEREGITYPSNKRIDYVLLSADLRDTVRSARVMTEASGSDHWPLLVELDL